MINLVPYRDEKLSKTGIKQVLLFFEKENTNTTVSSP
jgi:hypothetical protein